MAIDEGDTSSGEDRLFADLAERLRVAHRQVAAIPSSNPHKPVLTRRLIAISDAAKHDLNRASRRLDALLTELS